MISLTTSYRKTSEFNTYMLESLKKYVVQIPAILLGKLFAIQNILILLTFWDTILYLKLCSTRPTFSHK